MEQALSAHPGLLFSFSQPIATRVDELLSGVKAQLAVKLFGPDLDVLAEKGREIEALVKTVPGARDVALEPIAGESQLVVRPDRDRLARFGIPVAQVMDLVAEAIGGMEAGQVIRGNERYDIRVRLAPRYRKDVEAIGDLILDRRQRGLGAAAGPGAGEHRVRAAPDPPRRRAAPGRGRGQRERARHGRPGGGDRPAHRR